MSEAVLATERSASSRRPESPTSVRHGFADRHIGPSREDVERMLRQLGYDSLAQLMDQTLPAAIRMASELDLPVALSETSALRELQALAAKNEVWRSHIGLGYYPSLMPAVVRRNVLENPAWYTAYTPYQAEIAQGRLEALLNFQTMVADLTALPLANASLLDEGTAAAEAMAVSLAQTRSARKFFASELCHPQTLEVLATRCAPLGVELEVGDHQRAELGNDYFGALLQYPATDGSVRDYAGWIEAAHSSGLLVTMATDLLSLTLLRPPGELGADIAVGSSQRFGVPLGYGGPHAGFFSCREELKRRLPGRVVGVSRDRQGRLGYRLALQTREQHIRRERATSNICTAQVLPAVLASMYAVYHGPEGLRRIADRVHRAAMSLAGELSAQGHELGEHPIFDTVVVAPRGIGGEEILDRCRERRVEIRCLDAERFTVSLDETTDERALADLVEIFAPGSPEGPAAPPSAVPPELRRESDYLEDPVFHEHRSETEMLRYLHRLAGRDITLTRSMIPLGSCTMKLNATAEMEPVSWPGFGELHPFASLDRARGYAELFGDLETWLGEITGFAGISLQPNAGSQGEYAGLLVIRRYHAERGDDRDVCLIPHSAHGTNPASAVMAGLRVVGVACDDDGNIDLDDLAAKIAAEGERLAALMVTYPSTHGVFEESIREVCDRVHAAGGQVYLDGANLNAMVGLSRVGELGADVCHLNLHKTFCIPHGGGGPGMGPIGVAEHLVAYLPGHRVVGLGGAESIGAVSSAPWGSPSILPISWMYLRMMGPDGLRRASEIAILNANYLAKRLDGAYPVLYRGREGNVAHECILDLRPLKKSAGIEVEDVAKRLMDFGFHAPTVSWPVPGTLMLEPTESETKAELDRFCEALVTIREEIAAIERGEIELEESPLRQAPHPAAVVTADDWDRSYSRQQAAYPAPWTHEDKYWPPVSRIDNAYGDRNLICTCPSVAELEAFGDS